MAKFKFELPFEPYDRVYYVNEEGIYSLIVTQIQIVKYEKTHVFICFPNFPFVALEEYGGSGTVNSHWEARILLGDYMNGYIYPEEQVISEFTLALLEDSGNYKAYYYTGGLMRYGKNKGCSFVRGDCVNRTTQRIEPKFENEFFDNIYSGNDYDSSCSSGRQSRTYFYFSNYYNLSESYSYFNDKGQGGYAPADYCPVAIGIGGYGAYAYYSYQCSEKGLANMAISSVTYLEMVFLHLPKVMRN